MRTQLTTQHMSALMRKVLNLIGELLNGSLLIAALLLIVTVANFAIN